MWKKKKCAERRCFGCLSSLTSTVKSGQSPRLQRLTLWMFNTALMTWCVLSDSLGSPPSFQSPWSTITHNISTLFFVCVFVNDTVWVWFSESMHNRLNEFLITISATVGWYGIAQCQSLKHTKDKIQAQLKMVDKTGHQSVGFTFPVPEMSREIFSSNWKVDPIMIFMFEPNLCAGLTSLSQ